MVLQVFSFALLVLHAELAASIMVKVEHLEETVSLSSEIVRSVGAQHVLPSQMPAHQSVAMHVTSKQPSSQAFIEMRVVARSERSQFSRDASGNTLVHEMQSIGSTLVLLLLGLPLSCCLGLLCCSLCNGCKRQPYKHQLLEDRVGTIKGPLDIAFRTACLEHLLPMASELSSKVKAEPKEGGSGFSTWKLGEVSLANFDVPENGFNLHIKDESDLQVSFEFVKICCVPNPIEWELPKLRSSGYISVQIDEAAVWFDAAGNGNISDFAAQLVDFEVKLYGGFVAFMLNLVKNAFSDKIRQEVEKAMEAQLSAVLQDIGPSLLEAMNGVREAAALLESLPEEVRENEGVLGDVAARAGPLLAAGKHEEAKALLAAMQKEHPEVVNAALAAAEKQHPSAEHPEAINEAPAAAEARQETAAVAETSPAAGAEKEPRG
mmetsp:Transcript_54299/g.94741  ORF Transcript_54299/g.94741 Transcript_54299/m.94741 type:complete len:434 (+) Transcript_54299:85-1386(+)